MIPNKIESDPIYLFDEVIKLVHDAADKDKFCKGFFVSILHLCI